MEKMEQKTISKNFVKVDDENFNVVETRETTTNINHKRVNIKLKTLKNNLKQDVSTIMKNENTTKIGCEVFNSVVEDLINATKELGIEVIIPDKISYEDLKKEIIDDEKAIKEQQEVVEAKPIK